MKKLILFDLDGVLLDSRENMRVAWKAVQTGANVQIPFESYFENIGRPIQQIFEIIGAQGDYDNLEQLYRSASEKHLPETPFFEGSLFVLKKLLSMDCHLGIVTSKDAIRTKIVISNLEIDFRTIQSPCGNFRGKPAPDYLLLAMANAGVDPDDCVYVGDMETDLEAARRAKIDYIHALWGYGPKNLIGDCSFAERLQDLPEIIQSL